MGLTTATVKHVLLLLNFVFAVLGFVLVAFGIFILVSSADNSIDHGENVAAGLIIALGVVIVIISIFGCLAAIHESRRKLLIYVISLTVLIAVQLIMASMASQGAKDGLSGSVRDGFEELWEHQQPDALAFYEEWLHCCGVNNTDDYVRIQQPLPQTCCKEHDCHLAENVYSVGCQQMFEEYLASKMLMFSIVSWILIVGEIVAAVLGWMLYSRLLNERRRHMRWM